MEYIYAAMLLHKLGKEVTEDHVKKVLEAAGAQLDTARVKSLVSSLQGINIDEAIKEAAIMPVASAKAEHKEEKKEEHKEEKKDDAQAAAGLGALFG